VITLMSQAAISVWLLVFAVVAYRIAGTLPDDPAGFRFGWALTGSAFLIQGINSAAHDAFAIAGFTGGPDSWAWSAVIWWHPILNHSRTFLLTTFCLVLTARLVQSGAGRGAWPWRNTTPILFAGMAIGGFVGWLEPEFSGISHYTAVALWDVMELLAMLIVLFVGLTSGRMDRVLWFCLGINAFVLAVSVLWFAALSRIDFAGQWVPMRYHIHFAKATLYAVMVALAYRMLRSLHNGERVQGFLETDRRVAPSLHG
jgi:hypothetical protein